MNRLIFLGTGPAGGTKYQQKGKSKRLESSALIKINKYKILIDVASFFDSQIKNIDRIDAILITHGHLDAIGGIEYLRKWQEKHNIKKIPLYTQEKTIEIIKRQYSKTNHLDFHPLIPYKKFSIFNTNINPLPVKHSIQKGFPTLGFSFEKNGKSLLTYVSDVSGWNKKTEQILKNAPTLIIDGAMWNMKMPAHLDIPKILPIVCKWHNKRIIFTQIGNTAPSYEKLKKEIRKMCPKAIPAYDGMKISF